MPDELILIALVLAFLAGLVIGFWTGATTIGLKPGEVSADDLDVGRPVAPVRLEHAAWNGGPH
jgi:hypothetical protein